MVDHCPRFVILLNEENLNHGVLKGSQASDVLPQGSRICGCPNERVEKSGTWRMTQALDHSMQRGYSPLNHP